MPESPPLPVAVIGAGPVGLAAAAHLVARGIEPLVFEAGDGPGATVRDWAHVRVFSPGRSTSTPSPPTSSRPRAGSRRPPRRIRPAARSLIATSSRSPSCHSCDAASDYGSRVTAVTRVGIDKLKDAGRDEAPFELIVDRDGREQRVLARAVIDASGTWTKPNPLGAGGVPAAGERAASRSHRLPHPRRARARPRALRRQARDGGRHRPLGVQRARRPGRAPQGRAGHRDRVGGAARGTGRQARRRRRRPAARARRARRDRPPARSTTAPSSWSPASRPAASPSATAASRSATALARWSPTR